MPDTTDPTTAPLTTTTTPTTKPGYKTTEFWFKVAAFILSCLFASGAITNDKVLAIAGIAASWLTSMGYTVSRTLVKSAAAKTMLVIMFMLGVGAVSSTGCHTVAPQVIHTVEDCINQDRPAIISLIESFWPKDGGAPHWNEIETAGLAAGVHVGGCAIHEFVQQYLTPAPGNHAPDPLNGWAAEALIVSFDSKAKLADRVTFKTPHGNL